MFDEFFPGFRAKFQKIVTCVAFSINFAKTNQKFAKNSEFCEKKVHYYSKLLTSLLIIDSYPPTPPTHPSLPLLRLLNRFPEVDPESTFADVKTQLEPLVGVAAVSPPHTLTVSKHPFSAFLALSAKRSQSATVN